MQSSVPSKGDIFQTGILRDSGGLNMKCYISPELGESKFSDSGVSFCIDCHWFELQAVFQLLHFHGEK